jgi:hypothetical protein
MEIEVEPVTINSEECLHASRIYRNAERCPADEPSGGQPMIEETER